MNEYPLIDIWLDRSWQEQTREFKSLSSAKIHYAKKYKVDGARVKATMAGRPYVIINF